MDQASPQPKHVAITQGDVENAIVDEVYFNAEQGYSQAMRDKHPIAGVDKFSYSALTPIVFCVMILRNGHRVIGVSEGPLDASANKEDIGRKIARDRCIEQVYALLAYEHRCIAKANNLNMRRQVSQGPFVYQARTVEGTPVTDMEEPLRFPVLVAGGLVAHGPSEPNKFERILDTGRVIGGVQTERCDGKPGVLLSTTTHIPGGGTLHTEVSDDPQPSWDKEGKGRDSYQP